MSADLGQRVPAELGRVPTTGLTRGELAILRLDVHDVHDDLVGQALGDLLRRGRALTTVSDIAFGRLVRHHPAASDTTNARPGAA
jgi:hypothetical protein